MDRLQELVRLHRMGTGAREVARMLGMSPTTERTYRVALAGEGLLAGTATDELPLLEVLRAAVEKRLPSANPPQMVSLEAIIQKRAFSIIPSAGARGLRGGSHHRLAGRCHRIVGSQQTVFWSTATEVI